LPLCADAHEPIPKRLLLLVANSCRHDVSCSILRLDSVRASLKIGGRRTHFTVSAAGAESPSNAATGFLDMRHSSKTRPKVDGDAWTPGRGAFIFRTSPVAAVATHQLRPYSRSSRRNCVTIGAPPLICLGDDSCLSRGRSGRSVGLSVSGRRRRK